MGLLERFKRFWSDPIDYQPICSGAAGIIEREIHFHRSRIKGRDFAIEVPEFIYNEYKKQVKDKQLNVHRFMGVFVACSEDDRITFTELRDIQTDYDYRIRQCEYSSLVLRESVGAHNPRTEAERKLVRSLALSLENYEHAIYLKDRTS